MWGGPTQGVQRDNAQQSGQQDPEEDTGVAELGSSNASMGVGSVCLRPLVLYRLLWYASRRNEGRHLGNQEQVLQQHLLKAKWDREDCYKPAAALQRPTSY